jgi:hypothetical protein
VGWKLSRSPCLLGITPNDLERPQPCLITTAPTAARSRVDCKCGNDYCPDCGDAIQQDSEKTACSCTIWEVLPDR